MYKENNSPNFLIMDLLLVIYGLEAVFPPVTIYFNSTLICTICMFGWVCISFITDSDYYLKQDLRNTYPLIFIAATIIIPYLFGNGVIGNRYLSLCMIPLGYFIFNFYKEKERLNELKKVTMIICGFAVITFFVTLKALVQDPYISRSIKSWGEYSLDLARKGIGGYGFIYFTVIVSQFLLYIFLKSKLKFVKAFSFIFYLLSLFFTLKSNYMTALLTVLIASAVMIIRNYMGKNVINNIILILFAALMIILALNIDSIVANFSDFIPKRIAQIVNNGNESITKSIFNEFVNDRWPTMLSSINIFLKRPLLGMVASKDITLTQDGYLAELGQHSHILDTFALYGFLIGLFNILIIFKPFRGTDGKKIGYGKALNAAMAVCIIAVYLFNNATPSTAFSFGIIFPLIRELYNTKEVE